MKIMRNKKCFIGLVFLFLIAGSVQAQIDDPNSRDSGKRIERESKGIGRESSGMQGSGLRIDKGFSSGPKKKHFLGEPDSPTLDRKKEDDKVDIQQKEEYVNRTVDFKPAYINEFKNEGEVYPEFARNQDLGKYTTEGDYVKISWRDAQVVDGDRVDIIVNDEVIVHNVTLLANYHSVQIDLDQGFTKIEFKALNQGESGPNTADFKVEEADGTILTHDEWNLTTGTKASLVVIKN